MLMPIVLLRFTLNTAMLLFVVTVEEPAATPPVQLVVVSQSPFVVPDHDWAEAEEIASSELQAARRKERRIDWVFIMGLMMGEFLLRN